MSELPWTAGSDANAVLSLFDSGSFTDPDSFQSLRSRLPKNTFQVSSGTSPGDLLEQSINQPTTGLATPRAAVRETSKGAFRLVGDKNLYLWANIDKHREMKTAEHITPYLNIIQDMDPLASLTRYEYLIEETPPTATTGSQHLLDDMSNNIFVLFIRGRKKNFEDGIESEFSKDLVRYILSGREVALDIISDLIVNEKINAEVASEALRWLGSLDHIETYLARGKILKYSLLSQNPRVRDGALLGLSYLEDPGSIAAIEKAIENEAIPELREDMIQVLKELECLI